MNDEDSPIGSGTVAPLRNVQLLAGLVKRLVDRGPALPGMGTFFGPSGFGKSYAAIYAANKHRAYHVQVKSVWTRKALVIAILREMGVAPANTIPEMVDQIGSQLVLSRRPLIVDEADFLLTKGMIEVIRDIYESSQGAIVLIGEEQLPHKLKAWERVHGRMLDWVAAQPGTLADLKHLARLYCAGIEISDDLMAALAEASAGSIRRGCVNLDRIRETAAVRDTKRMKLADWTSGGGEFFTGAPPARRLL